MSIKCNNWECPQNKAGVCSAKECETFDDVLATVHGRKETQENG